MFRISAFTRPLRATLILAVSAASVLVAFSGGAAASSTSNQSACRLVAAAAHPKVTTGKRATKNSAQIKRAIHAALHAPNQKLQALARKADAAMKSKTSKPVQSIDLSSAAAFAALLKGCAPYLK